MQAAHLAKSSGHAVVRTERAAAVHPVVTRSVSVRPQPLRPAFGTRRKVVTFAVSSAENAVPVDPNDLPVPDGTMGWPILGEQPQVVNDGEFARKRLKKYGPIFKTRAFGNKTIYISGLKNIQEANATLGDALVPFDTFAPLFGENSMALMTGKDHTVLRKSLKPAFTGPAVDGYVPAIAERARNFTKKWAEMGTVNFTEQAKEFAFEITAKGIMGISYMDYSNEEVLKIFNTWWPGFLSLPINLPFTNFGKAVKTRKTLSKLMDQNIEAAMAGKVDSKKALAYMVSTRDENGNALSHDQIRDTIFTIIAAGYDTTAATINIVLLQLAKHPEVLEKVRAEQEEVMAKYGTEINGAAVKAMPYLEAVVKESIRAVPFGGSLRKVTRTVGFKGFKIPKGWNVCFDYATTLRALDDRWPSDADFKPERYMTDEGKKQGSFIPFGVGVHACLGNIVAMVEIKTLAACIARDCDFEIDELNPTMTFLPVPTAVGGLEVRFKRRGDTANAETNSTVGVAQ